MTGSDSIFKAKPNSGLLLICLLVLIVIKPAMDLVLSHYNLEQHHYLSLLEQAVLIVILCASAVTIGKIGLGQLGITAWRNWTSTNKRVFLIVTPLVLIVFFSVFFARVRLLAGHSELYGIGVLIVLKQFLYGCYQELLYRGFLQTELVKRWGFWIGTLVSNLVFTFGPEHFHFYRSSHIGFVFMFCLGLLFSIVFYRLRNLVLVGVWHGIGNAFIDGLRVLVSMI